jgi:hypothetical protein
MRRAALLLLAAIALAPAVVASAPHVSTLAGVSQSAPTTPAAANTTAPGVRLSEVLFHPAEGQPGFIELLNTGAIDATLDGLALVNEQEQTVALPRGLAPLAAGADLLVVFDGKTRVEDSVLHAAPADFLTLNNGAVALRGADQMLLDAVAWGAGQPDAINLGRGAWAHFQASWLPAPLSAARPRRPAAIASTGPSSALLRPHLARQTRNRV